MNIMCRPNEISEVFFVCVEGRGGGKKWYRLYSSAISRRHHSCDFHPTWGRGGGTFPPALHFFFFLQPETKRFFFLPSPTHMSKADSSLQGSVSPESTNKLSPCYEQSFLFYRIWLLAVSAHLSSLAHQILFLLICMILYSDPMQLMRR